MRIQKKIKDWIKERINNRIKTGIKAVKDQGKDQEKYHGTELIKHKKRQNCKKDFRKNIKS